MNIQRFSGATSREAMQKVKASLGDDALIIGNRATDFGIEIIAAPDGGPVEAATGDLPGAQTAPPARDGAGPGVPSPADEFSRFIEASARPVGAAPASVEIASVPGPAADFGERLMAEMREVKKLLASSSARMQDDSSSGGRLHGLLLAAGFGEELANELLLALPERLQERPRDAGAVADWLERQLALRLPAPVDGEALIDAGGIFALVGPTGSGKTTTTAKIAAQYVLRHGSESLALVSTDYYRIGAHEQLREYSGLLDATFRAVEEGQSLAHVLEGLQHKKVVLVDTVGLSQRDERVLEQFAELGEASDSLTFFLLLAGSSHQHTLDEVVQSYRRSAEAAGAAIDHCILTKIDEAYSPALLLDKVIYHALRPAFLTSGQRVPEDIAAPELPRLLAPLVEKIVAEASAEIASRPAAASRPADWTRHLLSRGRQLSMTMRLFREAVPGARRLETLWGVSLLHPTWQPARVAEILEQPVTTQIAHPRLLWSAEKPGKEGGWLCPHLVLDERLAPTAVTVTQDSDDAVMVQEIDARLRCEAQLFSALPDAAVLHALHEGGTSWTAPITRRALIEVDGETMSAARAQTQSHDAGDYAVACRARAARLRLRRLPCTFEAAGDEGPERFTGVLWSGVALCERTGAVLRRRYWLTSQDAHVDALLRSQFTADGYSVFTRHAMQKLDDMPGFQACPTLRLLVASGLAAAAMRIEKSPAPRDAELRGQLMAVLGGKRACTTRALVDALAYLFVAQELLEPARTN